MHETPHAGELRLLLEELCCDLSRFEHVLRDGMAPEEIAIDREVALGRTGAFADIRVQPRGREAYYIEVKYGYSNEAALGSVRRKFGGAEGAADGVSRIVFVIERLGRQDWDGFLDELAGALPAAVKLEIWDEERLLAMLRTHFDVHIRELVAEQLLDVRQAIDHAKGFRAFGGVSQDEYEHDPLRAQLLWHFGFWRLRQIREPRQLAVREIVPPGNYRDVVILIADLCSFSSFVRDTPSGEIIRENLTAFYSKARYQILNHGGMHYQFVGDEVAGVFGLPDRAPGYVEAAFETARALCSIGRSTSHEWQRQIDRVQSSGGLHIGMALGDLHLLSQRPFSRTHIGLIGDCLNVAARLGAHAGADQIVVSNGFYQRLSERARAQFREDEPVEAKNVGRIKAWKTTVG